MLHNLTTPTFGPDREARSPQIRQACADTIERLEQRVMLAASDGDVVARGDFNGDDRRDVIVYRRNAGRNRGAQLRVFVGTEDGFRRASTIQVGIVRDVAVGDFNNDGSLDLVIAQKRREEALKKAAKGLRLRGVGADDDGTSDQGSGDNVGNNGGGANNVGGNNAGDGDTNGGNNSGGGNNNGGNGGEVCGSGNGNRAGASGLRTLAVGDDGDSDQEPVDGDGDRDDEDPDDGDGGPNDGPGDDDDDPGQDDDGTDDEDEDEDDDDDTRTGGLDNDPPRRDRRDPDPDNPDTRIARPGDEQPGSRRGRRGGLAGGNDTNGGRNANGGKGLRGNAGSLTILMGNGNGTFDAARMVSSNVFGVSRIRVGDFNDDGDLDLRVRARNIDADGEPIKGGGRTTVTFFGEGDGTFRRGKNA